MGDNGRDFVLRGELLRRLRRGEGVQHRISQVIRPAGVGMDEKTHFGTIQGVAGPHRGLFAVDQLLHRLQQRIAARRPANAEAGISICVG